MRVRIEASNDLVAASVRRLLSFALAPVALDIAAARVRVDVVYDPLGVQLTRCCTELDLCNGQRVAVEEMQSRQDLAVSRALNRCARTVQRRLRPA